MAFTQDDIDAIDRAIKSGVLTVRHLDGRQVTYQSMDDMLKARALMVGSVNGGSVDQFSRVSYSRE